LFCSASDRPPRRLKIARRSAHAARRPASCGLRNCSGVLGGVSIGRLGRRRLHRRGRSGLCGFRRGLATAKSTSFTRSARLVAVRCAAASDMRRNGSARTARRCSEGAEATTARHVGPQPMTPEPGHDDLAELVPCSRNRRSQPRRTLSYGLWRITRSASA
jgi:hypothetical protein